MKKTSEFVKSHTAITDKESRTILHCRKSRLLHEYEAWKKQVDYDCFDLTIGSFNGAEICDLVEFKFLTMRNHNTKKLCATAEMKKPKAVVHQKEHYQTLQAEKTEHYIVQSTI